MTREHVSELHYRLRETPAAANEAVSVLSRMLNRAEAWDLLPAGGNPCRFVSRYRLGRPERFLTGEEFRRLGSALDALEAEGRMPAHPAAALRLLMLTGCRTNEILTLAWEDVHLEANELRLRDSKTGPRAIPLSPSAVGVLKAVPRAAGNPWVIAGRKPGTRLTHLGYYWRQVRERARVGDDVRVHDLRHSFASRALALGESLAMIGKLLGHRKTPDHRPLRPPRPRLGQGVRGPGRGEHRRGPRGDARLTAGRSRLPGPSRRGPSPGGRGEETAASHRQGEKPISRGEEIADPACLAPHPRPLSRGERGDRGGRGPPHHGGKAQSPSPAGRGVGVRGGCGCPGDCGRWRIRGARPAR